MVKKDEENRQLAELVQDMERRMKKAQACSKGNARLKRDVRDKDKDLHKMRKDIIEMKGHNETLQREVKELRRSSSGPGSRVPAASQQRMSFVKSEAA